MSEFQPASLELRQLSDSLARQAMELQRLTRRANLDATAARRLANEAISELQAFRSALPDAKPKLKLHVVGGQR